jgi:hypothetical protein
MPSIAGFQVNVFQGFMPSPTRRQSEEIVPGVNGQTVILGAWTTPETNIRTTMVLESKEEAQQRRKNILNFIGHEIYLMDQYDETFNHIFVANASPQIFGIANGTWEVITDWTIRPQAKPPSNYQDP